MDHETQQALFEMKAKLQDAASTNEALARKLGNSGGHYAAANAYRSVIRMLNEILNKENKP